MALAMVGKGVVWGLALAGAVLLNVIEGGKRNGHARTERRVDLASVLNALAEAVFLLDGTEKIVVLNDAAGRLIGQPRKKVLGCSVASLLREKLENSDTLAALLRQAASGEAGHSKPTVFRGPQGETMRVEVSASPACNQTGQVNGVLLAVQDVTELSALQQNSDSNERHVAVGQMTAGLVHDFNNVLNTISEAVSVLENDRERSARDRTVLGIIGNAVHYGAETIRNTREFLVGGKEKPGLVNIRALLEEVLELTHPVLKTHTNVTIVRETQDCGKVVANPDELRRAFTNLVLNSLDAMPDGGTLTVNCSLFDRRVVVSVRDTGVGIPAEAQNKIFSPYYTTKSKGTGLGLAGARRAIEAQGGEIRFESARAKGTTFYVTLPLAHDRLKQAPSAA